MTDSYNDVLSEYLVHVESLNCSLRQQVRNLQAERRGVKQQLVITNQRNEYFQKRVKKLETENRNLSINSKLGNRTLDYKSSVCHSHQRTSTSQNDRSNDNNKKRKKVHIKIMEHHIKVTMVDLM